MAKNQKQQCLPLLLTSHGENSPKQSFYNLLHNRYRTTSIPVLTKKSIIGSAYGWLVLLDRTDYEDDAVRGDCCLWNPKSTQTIQLPELEFPYLYNRCIFSKPPTDPDCFIIFTQNLSSWQLIYNIGDNSAFKVDSEVEGYRVMASLSYQGTIYGITDHFNERLYEFVTIHLAGGKLETTSLLINHLLPAEVFFPFNLNYLIQSPRDNEFLLVTKTLSNSFLETGVRFKVFRVDVVAKQCEEIENLDGRTIFISECGEGICRSTESCGEEIQSNSIYYTNDNGMVINVYCLDDSSTTMLLPYPKDIDIDHKTSLNFWVDIPEILNSSVLVV